MSEAVVYPTCAEDVATAQRAGGNGNMAGDSPMPSRGDRPAPMASSRRALMARVTRFP
jgi:hypothetical protein